MSSGMRASGIEFANWYCPAYTDPEAGNLTAFKTFQESVGKATGTLLTRLLIPIWRKETHSLILAPAADKSSAEKEASAPSVPAQAKEEHVRNAEEFVCLSTSDSFRTSSAASELLPWLSWLSFSPQPSRCPRIHLIRDRSSALS